MNATTPENSDELDRLFSEFFQAQLQQPWPKAPVPTAARPAAEPSELAAPRREAAHTQPAARDTTARARFTLAASVALVVGASWFLSNGFPGGTRNTDRPGQPAAPSMLPDSGAHDESILKAIQKGKANGTIPDGKADKIDLTKGE